MIKYYVNFQQRLHILSISKVSTVYTNRIGARNSKNIPQLIFNNSRSSILTGSALDLNCNDNELIIINKKKIIDILYFQHLFCSLWVRVFCYSLSFSVYLLVLVSIKLQRVFQFKMVTNTGSLDDPSINWW